MHKAKASRLRRVLLKGKGWLWEWTIALTGTRQRAGRPAPTLRVFVSRRDNGGFTLESLLSLKLKRISLSRDQDHHASWGQR